MNIPERKKIRSKPKIKNLCIFEGTKCWFDKTDKTIKFRQIGRKKKTEQVSIIELWDKASGQLKLL
jgi:hypothetical protein